MAAGPTTSIREEPYQGDVMRHFSVKAVIGKGGMGRRRWRPARRCRASTCTPSAARLADRADGRKVVGVYKLEFGVPEALWVIEVKDFPAVVTMDAHGNSLHAEIEARSRAELERLLAG